MTELSSHQATFQIPGQPDRAVYTGEVVHEPSPDELYRIAVELATGQHLADPGDVDTTRIEHVGAGVIGVAQAGPERTFFDPMDTEQLKMVGRAIQSLREAALSSK